MVEQWSSKSHAWVRFLLLLLLNKSGNQFVYRKASPAFVGLVKAGSSASGRGLRQRDKLKLETCAAIFYFKKATSRIIAQSNDLKKIIALRECAALAFLKRMSANCRQNRDKFCDVSRVVRHLTLRGLQVPFRVYFYYANRSFLTRITRNSYLRAHSRSARRYRSFKVAPFAKPGFIRARALSSSSTRRVFALLKQNFFSLLPTLRGAKARKIWLGLRGVVRNPALLNYFSRARLFFSELSSGLTNNRIGVTAYMISIRDQEGVELIRLTHGSTNFGGFTYLFRRSVGGIVTGGRKAVCVFNSFLDANLTSKRSEDVSSGECAPTSQEYGFVAATESVAIEFGNRCKPLFKKFKKTLNHFAAITKLGSLFGLSSISEALKYTLLARADSSARDSVLNGFSKFAVRAALEDYFYFCDKSPRASNITVSGGFSYAFKKRILKYFDYSKFSGSTIAWQCAVLSRFLEFCSGKKVCLSFYPFLSNDLDFYEKAQCALWAQRVKYFRKVLGPQLFLAESLQIIYLSLKLKDPFVLSNWMIATFRKISFWKFKTFLRYIKYAVKSFFWIMFKRLGVRGIKFQLKGKISVAGNARTRTAFHYVGFTSHTTFENRILYVLNLVRTFTGVQGLKLWVVF